MLRLCASKQVLRATGRAFFSSDGAALQKAFVKSAIASNIPKDVLKEERKISALEDSNIKINETNHATKGPVVENNIPDSTPIRSPTPTAPKVAPKTLDIPSIKKVDVRAASSPPNKISQPYMDAGMNLREFSARICVIGVGGAGCNAVNNMVSRGLSGVDFVCTNTDAQHLASCLAEKKVQLGRDATEGLGCGANPKMGSIAAAESKHDLLEAIGDAHLVFITAGMGGGTGTGAAPIVAELCQEMGILTVAVVTKPFSFEGRHRMRLANEGILALQDRTDTLITIPNQNLFSIVDKSTSFIDAFKVADDVLLAGVKSITDLIIKPGLINLDFADVRTVISCMGNAMMGTGQAEGEDRAKRAAQDALLNPLLGSEGQVRSAKGLLVNITGGSDLTLFEVDQAAQHINDAIEDPDANIIFGSSYDPALEGSIRVAVVATGFDAPLA